MKNRILEPATPRLTCRCGTYSHKCEICTKLGTCTLLLPQVPKQLCTFFKTSQNQYAELKFTSDCKLEVSKLQPVIKSSCLGFVFN